MSFCAINSIKLLVWYAIKTVNFFYQNFEVLYICYFRGITCVFPRNWYQELGHSMFSDITSVGSKIQVEAMTFWRMPSDERMSHWVIQLEWMIVSVCATNSVTRSHDVTRPTWMPPQCCRVSTLWLYLGISWMLLTSN